MFQWNGEGCSRMSNSLTAGHGIVETMLKNDSFEVKLFTGLEAEWVTFNVKEALIFSSWPVGLISPSDFNPGGTGSITLHLPCLSRRSSWSRCYWCDDNFKIINTRLCITVCLQFTPSTALYCLDYQTLHFQTTFQQVCIYWSRKYIEEQTVETYDKK